MQKKSVKPAATQKPAGLFVTVDRDANTREWTYRGDDHPKPNWPIDTGRLWTVSAPAQRLYQVFVRRTDYTTGRGFWKYATLAAWARLNVGHVARAIDDLLAAYLIVRSGRVKRCAAFRVVGTLAEADQLAREHPATAAAARVKNFQNKRAGRAAGKRAGRACDKRARRAGDVDPAISLDPTVFITQHDPIGSTPAADTSGSGLGAAAATVEKLAIREQIMVDTGVELADAVDLARTTGKLIAPSEFRRLASIVESQKKKPANMGGWWRWALRDPRRVYRGDDEAIVREKEHRAIAADRPRPPDRAETFKREKLEHARQRDEWIAGKTDVELAELAARLSSSWADGFMARRLAGRDPRRDMMIKELLYADHLGKLPAVKLDGV